MYYSLLLSSCNLFLRVIIQFKFTFFREASVGGKSNEKYDSFHEMLPAKAPGADGSGNRCLNEGKRQRVFLSISKPGAQRRMES